MNSPDTLSGGKRSARAAKTSSPSAPRPAVPRTAKSASAPIPPEERRQMIEVCAYFLAQQRGFTPGRDQDDWFEAEARVDQQLARATRGTRPRGTRARQ